MEGSYNESNTAQRERLRALVARLSDEDLRREVRDGWTVAALLSHLAMLDRLRLEGWKMQERSTEHQRWFVRPEETDLINKASMPALLALDPRVAAQQAVEAAEAVDAKIASLPPELAKSYLAVDDIYERRMLNRAIHRSSHLDEIEKALGRSQGSGIGQQGQCA